MAIIKTYNPATGEVLNEYEELTHGEINYKIEVSDSAYESWKKVPFSEKSKLFIQAADILEKNKEEYGRLMALEMGKPLPQGISEAEKCAWICRYYAENAENQLQDEYIQTESQRSYVTYQPIGSVLAIMPWNFPLWQVFRFAVPTLMAGNTGLLKHSRNTMGCAIEIENIFRQAGFPDGVFTNLAIGSAAVEKVIEHPLIAAVTLTGSTPVGMKVASKAGSLIKKTVLELGGSDPYIILEDADLEKAAETCVNARLINSGQSCIAAKRFIVVKSVFKKFEEVFVDRIKHKRMGDPLAPNIDFGPQARKDLQETLQEQVNRSNAHGARLLLGGRIPAGKGFFYPATVLTDVEPGMAAFDEETFGPVAALIPAENEEQAIKLANNSNFGLGASIFTQDIERSNRIAREELSAGSCFVNTNIKSDPRLPFGGIKDSGYGRELSSFGIKEFVNIKTVVVA